VSTHTAVPSVRTTPPIESAETVEPRRAMPIQIWAGIGIAWLAVMILLWGTALVRGRLKPNQIGAGAMPTWMHWTLHGSEVAYLTLGVVVGYFLLWKPWRRDGVITFDGALVIGFLTMWMTTDSWATYLRPLYIYNAGAINLGCPQCQVPGALDTNWSTSYVEPIGLLGLYAGGLTLGVIFACWTMRRAQARWPRMGKIGLTLIMLPAMIFADVLLEVPFMMAGWWTYANAIPQLTIFAGHYYQYPIYEGVFMWVIWSGWSLVRHFKNDKGETIIERGLSDLATSRRKKNALRVLAVIGMINTIAVLGYHLPLQFVTIHSKDYPADVLDRPYFLHGACGPGTSQACPGEGVPIQTSRSGAYQTPDGRLVAPAGVRIQYPPYNRTSRINP
jgi:hypothetical protein